MAESPSLIQHNEWLRIALQHHHAGRFAPAEAMYRQILAENPNQPDALHLLGMLAFAQNRFDEAIALIGQAVALDGSAPEFHAAYAQALAGAGRIEAAIDAYQLALRLRNEMPEVHFNLGCLLRSACRFDEAASAFRAAIAQRPDFPQAHSNVGNVLREQGDLAGAADCYRRAIAAQPDYAPAYVNLAQALKAMGELDEAITNFDRALAIDPDLAAARSGKIYTRLYHPLSTVQSLLADCREWNIRHVEPLRNAALRGSPQTATATGLHQSADGAVASQLPPTKRRLRIGYVSPDFRHHVAGFYLRPLLREHDRDRFEIICYSNVSQPDEMTAEFRSYAEGWRDIHGMPDEQAAEKIRQDGIDILIDTTMHMGGNRLMLFAHKPAPLQATMCAYPGSTGLATMDYRFTDIYLDPPGEADAAYTERSIRLPDSFWCYEPMEDAPAVGPLPAASAGYITFGCLNNFCKVNDAVLARWAAIMRQSPRSRLLLMTPPSLARQGVLDKLHQLGIDAGRIDFTEHQPRRHYLALYHRIDICLDTVPYNGHMTSLDAFWMGVPVVTFIGQLAVGRAGFCQLNNLGLPELAGRDDHEFVDIATRLAADLPRLQSLRAGLRQRMMNSPLTDAAKFTRNVEAAFTRIYFGQSTQNAAARLISI